MTFGYEKVKDLESRPETSPQVLENLRHIDILIGEPCRAAAEC